MSAAKPDDPLHCVSCAARLTHDQRYCLDCGTRRGALPGPVAELLGTMLEQGDARRSVPLSPAPPARTFEPDLPFGLTMPSPRAAAVAVFAMLTLGVIVGTTVAPPVQTFAAGSPLILAVSPHGLASTAVNDLAASTDSSGGGGDAGGGGGTQTVTVVQTTTAPSSASPTSGFSSGAGTAGPVTAGPGSSSGPTNPLGLPPVKHLFLIMLSDAGFRQTFAPGSSDTYLSKTLAGQGKLIYNYFAVAGGGLANAIALISGQGPTRQTVADCPTFTAITPGTTRAHHQVAGDGCVYPRSMQTLADQLKAKGDTWKAYVEGVDSGPPGQPTSCRHPALGADDPYHTPRAGDSYVTWRNPFVYFASLTSGTACQRNDVGLGGLTYDLQTPSTAPTVAYIVPGPCDDGNPQPCNGNAVGGLAAADRFLQTVVPEIEQSAAYQDGGLIAITSDEAPQTGPYADSTSCCGTPRYPNLARTAATDPATTTGTSSPTSATTPADTTAATPTSTTDTTMTPTTTGTTTTTTGTTSSTPTTTGTTSSTPTTTGTTSTSTTTASPGAGVQTPATGGGQVGLLLISKFVKKNSVDVLDSFNHYSLLASVENLFGLKKLGYAAEAGLPVLDSSVFDGQGAGAARDTTRQNRARSVGHARRRPR